MLVLENVRFAYPGQGVSYNFDVRVPPGEIIGITGASGAGKSTLLDLIAGFVLPQSGTIRLNGTDFSRHPPQHRPVSILFQANNLFDHLSAAKNLGIALPRGLAKAEKKSRIAGALENVGMSEFSDRRAALLSGGQQQRLALARTLLLDRPVLLLDEPFSALDSQTAARLGALVKSLVARKGWHPIMVSHQHKALADLAMTTFQIKNGVLEKIPV